MRILEIGIYIIEIYCVYICEMQEVLYIHKYIYFLHLSRERNISREGTLFGCDIYERMCANYGMCLKRSKERQRKRERKERHKLNKSYIFPAFNWEHSHTHIAPIRFVHIAISRNHRIYGQIVKCKAFRVGSSFYLSSDHIRFVSFFDDARFL